LFPSFFIEVIKYIEIDFKNAFILDFEMSYFLFIEERRAEVDFLKRVDGELAVDTVDIDIDGHRLEQFLGSPFQDLHENVGGVVARL
jgi:hypothetical protein